MTLVLTHPPNPVMEIIFHFPFCWPPSCHDVQVCAALRKMSSVLRLGVYRERIEKYGRAGTSSLGDNEDMMTVSLERQTGKHLGIRISGSCPEPGIFIVEILEDSITALDGRIKPYDRLLSINGTDVRHCKISQASDLIKVMYGLR